MGLEDAGICLSLSNKTSLCCLYGPHGGKEDEGNGECGMRNVETVGLEGRNF